MSTYEHFKDVPQFPLSTELSITDANINACMFDFETGALGTNPALISFGAFFFNRFDVEETKLLMGVADFNYYANIDLNAQFFLGMEFNQATAKWWRERNSEQISVVSKDRQELANVLQAFFAMCAKFPDTLFFCRHTHCDYVWLESACKALGIKNAIPYNRIFDVSSVILQATNDPKGYVTGDWERNAHHALGDCHNDALQLATVSKKD